ncbi:MAG: DUF4845 domain-containing protein [Methylococcaceae bacterium]|nr:DUF4845 domain-containing protein [Methylococcaceae bacterium]
MQKLHKKQQGLTLISLTFVLGMIGFFTLLVLKVGPIYMDHSKVVQALESIKNRPGIENESKEGVWVALNKQFSMNYVYDIKKENVKITSRDGYLKVQIVYYTKQLLFSNLSVWVDFDNSIEVGKQ